MGLSASWVAVPSICGLQQNIQTTTGHIAIKFSMVFMVSLFSTLHDITNSNKHNVIKFANQIHTHKGINTFCFNTMNMASSLLPPSNQPFPT